MSLVILVMFSLVKSDVRADLLDILVAIVSFSLVL